jgi:sarcosine oxidase delta subunit
VVRCPYCGHQPEDADDFMTPQQNRRVQSAAEALVEQYAHQAIQDAFRGLATPRLRPGQSGIQITVSKDPPPPVRSLTIYVEEQVRRTITCDNCQTEYAVYGATAFCPVCGPRAALETVLEAIERGRRSLALEDALPEEMREQARADGLFDKTAADAVKETVTLFEVFARDQFSSRVPNHEDIVKQHGRGVFQRLDDADALFGQHCGTTLSTRVPADVWSRLQTVFQQRHVLVHQQGIVDAQYVQRVPHAGQQVGQRLVLGREDAEQALDALEAVVRALAAAP